MEYVKSQSHKKIDLITVLSEMITRRLKKEKKKNRSFTLEYLSRTFISVFIIYFTTEDIDFFGNKTDWYLAVQEQRVQLLSSSGRHVIREKS